MRARVEKRGNSLAVRNPRSFAAQFRLTSGAVLDIVLGTDQLVIAPVAVECPSLDELPAVITDDYLHGQLETGARVGAEQW